MYRTYRYKLLPKKRQIPLIARNMAGSDFVRNTCIKENMVVFAQNNAKELLDDYLLRFPELKKCDYSALIVSLIKLTEEDASSKRRHHSSYSTTYSKYLKEQFPINERYVFISRVGWVRYKNTRKLPENDRIIRFTIKKEWDRYFLLVSFEIDKKDENRPLDINCSIGLDYSSSNFVVDDKGSKYGIGYITKDVESIIAIEQAKMSNMEKGSRRYKRKQMQIARLYARIANRRRDHLHKVSTMIANRYDIVCVETLDMIEIAGLHHLAKKTYDNSFRSFVDMLEYKLEERGKQLIKIDRWFPSTKQCSKCGYLNRDITLSTREWDCPACGTHHDRDVNAAVNIRNEGIRIYTAGRAERASVKV